MEEKGETGAVGAGLGAVCGGKGSGARVRILPAVWPSGGVRKASEKSSGRRETSLPVGPGGQWGDGARPASQ